MRKVLLMCSQGASTSMLVQVMQDEAAKQGYECEISATSVTKIEDAGDADIILLGPQVGFMLDEAHEKAPCKVLVIPSMMYGLMDGKGVIDLVKAELGD